MRDFSAVLDEIGETAEAKRYAQCRRRIQKSRPGRTRKEHPPRHLPAIRSRRAVSATSRCTIPFLHTRIGSYWNIIIGYTIGSGIFPPGQPKGKLDSPLPGAARRLLHGHAPRRRRLNTLSGPVATAVNPLYGTRYALDTLRRDDPERALVSFYGMLAQGFTRNTFVSGEGCSL